MSKLDSFDNQIKDALDKYEASFDPSSWQKIEKQLPKPSGFNGQGAWFLSAGVIAVGALVYWFYSSTPSEIKTDFDPINDTKTEEVISIESPIKELDTKTSIDFEEVESADAPELSLPSPKQEIKEKIPVATGFEETNKTQNLYPKDVKEDLSQETDEGDFEDKIEKLIVQWKLSNEVVCQNSEVFVAINEVNQPIDMYWDFGDGIKSKESVASHQYNYPGTYVVKLNAKSLIDDTKGFYEERIIEVQPKPQANFLIQENANMALVPEVYFKNLSENYKRIVWKGENITDSDKKTSTGFYRNKGSYDVTLIVENKLGCVDSITKSFAVAEDYNLMAPPNFTPNDDGINDYFIPEALNSLNKAFDMQIINPRDGKLVFETDNSMAPWDGKYIQTGEAAEEGHYAWTVKLDDGSVYSGTVKLIID